MLYGVSMEAVANTPPEMVYVICLILCACSVFMLNTGNVTVTTWVCFVSFWVSVRF